MSSVARKIIKYSQFQLKVLNLYAQFVRVSKDKPGLLNKVRTEFRKSSKLNIKNDSLLIDYKLRRATNQLDMLKTSRVSAVKTLKLENNKDKNRN